jgi:hypothetical protein
MTGMPSRLMTAALLCTLAAAPALARDKLDNQAVARFGGTYAIDCNDKASPRLHVVPDALIVDRGKQRMTASNPTTRYYYFGSHPPKNFRVALLAKVRGEFELRFMVTDEGEGNLIEIQGADKVLGTLGPSVVGRSFRRCEGPGMMVARGVPDKAPNESPVRDDGSATTGARLGTQDPAHAAHALEGQRFRKVWRDAVGIEGRTRWISNLEGPGIEPRWIELSGTRYVFNAYCKPRDCYDHNVVQLYDPVAFRVFGLVHQRDVDALVGNPSPAMTKKLQTLWLDTWRKHIR